MNATLIKSSVSFLLAVTVSSLAFASDPLPLTNWPVPSAVTGEGAVGAMADLSHAAIFIATTPCRVADTRNADGPYGGPKAAQGGTRTFDIDSGPCTGIPAGAAAYSLNFGVTQTAASGYLTAWDAGASQPGVATMTWFGPSQTLSNAAVVPASNTGAIDVYTAAATHVTIDINGYFMDAFGDLNPQRYFGVIGDYSGGGLFFARNQNTTSTSEFTASVRALMDTSQSGPSALHAWQTNPAGANKAITARNDSVSNKAYGLLGKAGTAAWDSPNAAIAGVRGIANGATYNYGVLGEGTLGGAIGFRVDSTGAMQTYGIVGYSGTIGLYTPNDLSVSGTKSFVEPHPTDAAQIIKYVALEGPEAGTYFRGRAKVRNGFAVIEVPQDFRMVSDEEGLTVQITPIGHTADYAVMSAGLDRVVVRASKEIEFYYLVQGVRKAFKDFQPLQPAERDGYFLPRGPDDRLESYAFNEEAKRRLVANGTFNEDGSVNLVTAERLGWAQQWRERNAAIAAYQALDAASAPDEQEQKLKTGQNY